MFGELAASTLATALLTLGAELLAGALSCAAVSGLLAGARGVSRAQRIAWAGAARALARLTPWALGLVAAGLAAGAAATGRVLRPWPTGIPFLAAGGAGAAGLWLLLSAGRAERLGRLRRARRAARLGGFGLLAGVFAQLVVVWGDLLFRVPFRRAALAGGCDVGLVLAAGMLALGVAAFVGVVAGLAGKPRPAAAFASVLWLSGLVALAFVAQAPC